MQEKDYPVQLVGSWKKFPSQNTPETQLRRSLHFAHNSLERNAVFNSNRKKIKKSVYIPASIGKLRFEKNRQFECFGLKKRLEHSFEANQSFPVIAKKSKINYEFGLITPPLKVSGMDKIRVDGANGLRFTARRKGYFTPGTGSPFSGSFVASAASETLLRVPQAGINPNKAVFTIDSKTSQILIVNHNACELLGYTPKELCEMLFSALLTNKNKTHVSALAEGQLNSEDGTMVLLSGKVVEMNTKHNTTVAVSLWIRQIDSEGRCLAVAEPVERRVAQILIDNGGYIISGDYEALMLFQLESLEQFCGMEIQTLIPAIQLPDADSSMIAKHVRKQKATGKTADGVAFPLCLMVTLQDNGTESGDSGVSNNTSHLYLLTIWVFQNISGLLVIDENGLIESCNHHFSMLMFGYSQNKILKRHISELIPNFGQDIDYLSYSRSRNITSSSLDNESETETDPVYMDNDVYVSTNSTDYNNAMQNISSLEQSQDTTSSCLDLSKANNSADNSAATASASIVAIPTTIGVPKKTSYLSKSLSDKILISENSENNKNVANIQHQSQQVKSVGAITFTSNKSSASDCILGNSCNSLREEQIYNECDLLTPVNETKDCIPGTSESDILEINDLTGNNTMFCSHDISDALNCLDTPPRINTDVTIGDGTTDTCGDGVNKETANKQPTTTPKFNPNCDLRQQLMTSTPDVRRHSSSYSIIPSSEVDPAAAAIASTSESIVNPSSLTQTITSATTPVLPSSKVTQQQYADGRYKGEAIHWDENIIDILYTISSQTLPCGRKVFCVWICRDPDNDYDVEDDIDADGKHKNLTLTFNSIASTIENSLGQAIKHTAAQNSSRPNSVSLVSQCEDDQINGEFRKYYTTLKQIGKGAYGYVKMAYRHTDRLLVVTKFILKEKLTPQFMILTEDKKDIPMEIYLLTTVKHPNIVTVYDVFENEKFFQLVMEKHGSGMDLFEFIDRRPMMDEKLGCFIFRQIANAVDYLHSLHILHRDIKDENIIIDQNFHVKLIDFGSATFMEEGKLFSTFYGTTEYCSPEVLAGNKYAGPELEMWSLGVTLYVLMFYENPFLDIEETLRGDLNIPNGISKLLESLLLKMLDKNPKTRCTMRQLQADPWIGQEINPAIFNFAWIVPCESHESNPEKYYSGQIYSSTTALSTMSPQDSLSLVDEDSIIDPEEDIQPDPINNDEHDVDGEEEEEDDEKSLPSQDEPILEESNLPTSSLSAQSNKLQQAKIDCCTSITKMPITVSFSESSKQNNSTSTAYKNDDDDDVGAASTDTAVVAAATWRANNNEYNVMNSYQITNIEYIDKYYVDDWELSDDDAKNN